VTEKPNNTDMGPHPQYPAPQMVVSRHLSKGGYFTFCFPPPKYLVQ